jgi:hypothetical protein
MEEKLYTTKKAAEVLRISIKTLCRSIPGGTQYGVN